MEVDPSTYGLSVLPDGRNSNRSSIVRVIVTPAETLGASIPSMESKEGNDGFFNDSGSAYGGPSIGERRLSWGTASSVKAPSDTSGTNQTSAANTLASPNSGGATPSVLSSTAAALASPLRRLSQGSIDLLGLSGHSDRTDRTDRTERSSIHAVSSLRRFFFRPRERTLLGDALSSGALDASLLPGSLRNLVSFEEPEAGSEGGMDGLLRSSRLGTILQNGAKILKDSRGSAATYELSEPATRSGRGTIDAFISHNWAVHRWRKFLCLALHFNLVHASAITVAVMALLSVLGCQGWVPVMTVDYFEDQPRGYLCRLVTVPVFLLTSLLIRDVMCCSCWRGPAVFLDKTCIHQEDPDRQREGIRKLGAFLSHSRTMVVCYTDLYLTKLWTVYEIATFLSLWPVDHIKIIPASVPKAVYGFLLLWYIYDLVSMIFQVVLGIDYADFFVVIALFFIMCKMLRRVERGKVKMLDRLATFDVRRCKCASEADRPFVYANICLLMRATHGLDEDISDQETLDCFNNLVVSELPSAVLWAFGKYNMRYRHLLVTIFFGVFSRTVDGLASMAYGMTFRKWLTYFFLWYSSVVFCVTPMSLAMLNSIASTRLHLVGWREKLMLAVPSIIGSAVLFAWMRLCDWLDAMAETSDLMLIFYISIDIVTGIIAGFVVGQAPRPMVLKRRQMQRLKNLAKDRSASLPDVPRDNSSVSAHSLATLKRLADLEHKQEQAVRDRAYTAEESETIEQPHESIEVVLGPRGVTSI